MNQTSKLSKCSFANVVRYIKIKIGERAYKEGWYPQAKVSFSQCGEDLIIKFLFDSMGNSTPSYIDIGAHHPEVLSNTALFYYNGSRGVNIEPDPILFGAFQLERKLDINLNIGISDQIGELDFYVISYRALNTFSKTAAEQAEKEGHRIDSVIKMQVDTLPHIITKYCKGRFPDILTLDVEGLDYEILNTIKYKEDCPTVICVETISYSRSGKGEKNTQLIEFLMSNGYLIYADTKINTIFVLEESWKKAFISE